MKTMKLLKTAIILFLILLVIDSIYIYSTQSITLKAVQDVQGSSLQLNFGGAGMTYLFLTLLLQHFIISKESSPLEAFILGICVYGVYDFTSLSIYKKYPVHLAFLDTLWGGLLFYLATLTFRFVSPYT